MADTTIIPNLRLNAGKSVFEAPETAAVALATLNTSKNSATPRGLAWLLGTLVLRSCPAARNVQTCEGCHLRVLCRCAQEDFRAGVAVERRVWAVLTVCAGVLIMYAAYCFLHRG